jgi:hypothetical protein
MVKRPRGDAQAHSGLHAAFIVFSSIRKDRLRDLSRGRVSFFLILSPLSPAGFSHAVPPAIHHIFNFHLAQFFYIW